MKKTLVLREVPYFPIFVLFFGLGTILVELSAYYWLFAQSSILEEHKGPYWVAGIEPGPKICRTSPIPTVLSLRTTELSLVKSW